MGSYEHLKFAKYYEIHVMCARITSSFPSRQFGAIPVLVSQLRNADTKVQISILGALRNLSFGRSNDENKLVIANEHGLPEVMLALKMSRVAEVRRGEGGGVTGGGEREEYKPVFFSFSLMIHVFCVVLVSVIN